MSGENPPLVGKLLGHRWHRTTAGHAHLVEAAERVVEIIGQAMGMQKPAGAATPHGSPSPDRVRSACRPSARSRRNAEPGNPRRRDGPAVTDRHHLR